MYGPMMSSMYFRALAHTIGYPSKYYQYDYRQSRQNMQEKRNSRALAMKLHLSCTDPSIYTWMFL